MNVSTEPADNTSFKEDVLLASVEWGFIGSIIINLCVSSLLELLPEVRFFVFFATWAGIGWLVFNRMLKKDWIFVRKAKKYGKYGCYLIFGLTIIFAIFYLIIAICGNSRDRHYRHYY